MSTGPRCTTRTAGRARPARPIVFSHGLLWGTELFAPQVAALRDRYRCIAWDHRGQGSSAGDRSPLHRHGARVAGRGVRCSRSSRPEPVHFVGLSMGGFVAMRMAARRPDLVRSLVLIESSVEPEPLRERAALSHAHRGDRALVGPRPLRARIAPIMLGKSILADPARKAEVERFVAIDVAPQGHLASGQRRDRSRRGRRPSVARIRAARSSWSVTKMSRRRARRPSRWWRRFPVRGSSPSRARVTRRRSRSRPPSPRR